MSQFLIVLGVVLLAFACRTYRHPAIRRLGTVALLGASFLTAYFLSGGSLAVGFLGIAFWFLLPWFEILTRIRELRLPVERTVEERHPPNRHTFPELEELTEAMEEEGFEQLADTGWEWDGLNQFVRVLFREEDRLEAAIYLSEQEGMSFYHSAVVTRMKDGRHVLTWDYPFSYTLRLPPGMEMHRVATGDPPEGIREMLEAHEEHLEEAGCPLDERIEVAADDLGRLMGEEMRRQVDHNLDQGIIRLAGDGTWRYTAKGFVFLWFRIVRDMLRLG